jgi:hypothetical protein
MDFPAVLSRCSDNPAARRRQAQNRAAASRGRAHGDFAVDVSFIGALHNGLRLPRRIAMSGQRHRILVLCIFCLALSAKAQTQDEMVANSFYRLWASFQPGDTAVHLEQTKLSGAGGETVPGGVDENRITYKLVEVTPEQVVLETFVRERDFLGYVEAAPTRQIYPAQIKKADLERILKETGAQTGEDTLKFDGREIKCKTMSGAMKGSTDELIEFKIWLSEEVPGHIIKKVRSTKHNGEVVAETTTSLQSYKKAN